MTDAMQVENGVYGCAGLLTAACDTLVLIALCIVQVCSNKMMPIKDIVLTISFLTSIIYESTFRFLFDCSPVNEQVGAPVALSGLVPLAIIMPCNFLLIRVYASHQEAAAKLRM